MVRVGDQLPEVMLRLAGRTLLRCALAIRPRSRPAREPGPGASRSRPPRKLSSITNAQPTTCAPSPPTSSHSAPARAARRKQIVVDEHPGATGERVGVHLERVDTVLEHVLGADRLSRQLAGLARRHEPHPQLAGERAPEDEAARLGGDHEIDRGRAHESGEPCHRRVQSRRVQQQRRDVLEHDSRAREVWDIPDVGAQIHRMTATSRSRRLSRSRSYAGRESAAGA